MAEAIGPFDGPEFAHLGRAATREWFIASHSGIVLLVVHMAAISLLLLTSLIGHHGLKEVDEPTLGRHSLAQGERSTTLSVSGFTAGSHKHMTSVMV
jgi:hypothetical protein